MKRPKISAEEIMLAQNLGAAIRPFFAYSSVMPARYIELFLLVVQDPGRSVEHYAEKAGVSNSTASRFLLDMGLGKKVMTGEDAYGLLWNERNPGNGREKITYLTNDGIKLLREVTAPFKQKQKA